MVLEGADFTKAKIPLKLGGGGGKSGNDSGNDSGNEYSTLTKDGDKEGFDEL